MRKWKALWPTVWGLDVKCHSLTIWGTIQVLQEAPRSDWNVICVGLRLLLALLLTCHCQRTDDAEGGNRGGLFLRFVQLFTICEKQEPQKVLECNVV